MTADEIRAMPAGRELNALVAENVMGWKWYALPTSSPADPLGLSERSVLMPPEGEEWERFNFHDDAREVDAAFPRFSDWDRCCARGDFGNRKHGLPDYSTDIAAAWEVVETLRKDRRVVMVKADGLRDEGVPGYTVLVDSLPRVDADTAPLAIARAALLATLTPRRAAA